MSNPDYFCRKSKNRNVLQELWLHFIKNHKTNAVSCKLPEQSFYKRVKSQFIFSYTQIVEFLFSRCFEVIRTRQFSASGSGPLASEVDLWPRNQPRIRSPPSPDLGASIWGSLKEISLFQQRNKTKNLNTGKAKINILCLRLWLPKEEIKDRIFSFNIHAHKMLASSMRVCCLRKNRPKYNNDKRMNGWDTLENI